MPRKGYIKSKWSGGYVTTGGVYVIYRKVNGRKYEISTRCNSSKAAHSHLERFEADPENYKPQGEAPAEGLALDDKLGAAFLRWSRETKRNTPKWVADQRRALVWWEERLTGVDLRTLKTSRIVAELEGQKTGRKQLIATFKTFYGWLRTERHLITTAQDPLNGQLSVPQAAPRQLTKRKAATLAEYREIAEKLQGWHRDALGVLGATGWHWSELERFAHGGKVELHPTNGACVLLCPHTKGGVPLRTQVPEVIAEPARRLQTEAASVDYFKFRDALKQAGAQFNPGFLRHSVASWAINAGADPASVAAFLGHKSPATTRKFYATHAVPLKIPTLADVGSEIIKIKIGD